MTDRLREAAQAALDALENHTAIKHPQQRHYRDAAIEQLRAALAEPEVEPVAYRHMHEDGWEYYDAPTGEDCKGCQALYTIKPRHGWKSLTDEEIESVADATPVDDLTMLPDTWHIRMSRAIERVLKEKNT